MAAPFLDEGQQRPVLGPQLGECMAQCVQLLGIDRARRLRNVFVLLTEGQENPAKLLAPQLIDARIPREAKEPRFKLRRRLQTIQCADHFDEHLLRQVLDVIAASSHGVDEARDAMLVTDNELVLGGFVALLSPPNKVGQRGR